MASLVALSAATPACDRMKWYHHIRRSFRSIGSVRFKRKLLSSTTNVDRMRAMQIILIAFLLFVFPAEPDPVWLVQTSGIDTNLRGISVTHSSSSSASASSVVWASGSNGVILRSPKIGNAWVQMHVNGGETLDFRGIQAFDDKMAYVMSSGEGEKSRIYRTVDGGQIWALQYTGNRQSFFLDALVCDSPVHCLALSDPVDGKFLILATSDGENWRPLPEDSMPFALKDEGAFAASGTCLAVYGNDIYFVTGGPAARLFHSPDMGRMWSVIPLPIVGGAAGAGAFSIARRGKNMIVVGGDYKNPERHDRIAAYSHDAGRTWKLAKQPPAGYRSAVAWLDDHTIATVGPTGEDISVDGGVRWKPNSTVSLNAVAALNYADTWAIGPNGAIWHFSNQGR
jgi:photosystem II stability/assembly factor-like uncharacterized protein